MQARIGCASDDSHAIQHTSLYKFKLLTFIQHTSLYITFLYFGRRASEERNGHKSSATTTTMTTTMTTTTMPFGML